MEDYLIDDSKLPIEADREWEFNLHDKNPAMREERKALGRVWSVTVPLSDTSKQCLVMSDLWMTEPKTILVAQQEWFAERLHLSLLMLKDCVEVDSDVLGGMPVLKHTRFPVYRVFAELADGLKINEIAADFDLDEDVLKKMLNGVALYFGRPF